MPFEDSIPISNCIICGDNLQTDEEKISNFHKQCRDNLSNEDSLSFKNMYSLFGKIIERCCALHTSIPVISSSNSEYEASLNNFNDFYNNSLNLYKNLIGNKNSDNLAVVNEFHLKNDKFLKSELQEIDWIIYEIPKDRQKIPFHLEELCKILNIKLKGSEFYSKKNNFLNMKNYNMIMKNT